MPSTGTSVGSSHVMRNILERHLGLLGWDINSTYGHSNISEHSTNPDNFTVIGKEDHGLAWTIKESIYIRVNNPTLNRNVGKYNLHYIWDRSCSAPLNLELIMTMGMQTEHPSVSMLSLSQSIGIHIEQQGILGMLRHLSMHIEHLWTNIRQSNSPFPSDLMKSSSCLDESLSNILTGVLLR